MLSIWTRLKCYLVKDQDKFEHLFPGIRVRDAIPVVLAVTAVRLSGGSRETCFCLLSGNNEMSLNY